MATHILIPISELQLRLNQLNQLLETGMELPDPLRTRIVTKIEVLSELIELYKNVSMDEASVQAILNRKQICEKKTSKEYNLGYKEAHKDLIKLYE